MSRDYASVTDQVKNHSARARALFKEGMDRDAKIALEKFMSTKYFLLQIVLQIKISCRVWKSMNSFITLLIRATTLCHNYVQLECECLPWSRWIGGTACFNRFNLSQRNCGEISVGEFTKAVIQRSFSIFTHTGFSWALSVSLSCIYLCHFALPSLSF